MQNPLHRGTTGLYLSVSQKIASMKGKKGRSSNVGNLVLFKSASICACAFSCTSGFTTIIRKNVIKTEFDCCTSIVSDHDFHADGMSRTVPDAANKSGATNQ